MATTNKTSADSPFAPKPRSKGKTAFFLILPVFLLSFALAVKTGWDVYQKSKKPAVEFEVSSPFFHPRESVIDPQPMFKADEGPKAPSIGTFLAASLTGRAKSAEEMLKGPQNVDEALEAAMLNYPAQKEINDSASVKENEALPIAASPESEEPAPVRERIIDVKDEFALRREPVPPPDPVQGDLMSSLPNFSSIKGGQNKGGIPLNVISPLSHLQSESRYGKIPVKSQNGETPFQAYARPYDKMPPSPYIAVLVSGLGKRKNTTTAALYALAPEVSLSFSPYSEQLGNYVAEARRSGHETLLDLPMQRGVFPETDPGPLGLVTGLPKRENRKRLHKTLGKDVAYIGVAASPNETFSTKTDQMADFAKEIRDRGLIYVDGTEDESVPLYSNALRPDVYITNNFYRSAIKAQLEYARRVALQKGRAFVRAETAPIVLLVIQEWMNSFVPEEGKDYPPVTFVPLSYYAKEVLKTRQ